MGEDSRVPPLSRRVPGATNRPKPQLRTAPPVLPDDLIERLRARAKTRSEERAEQVQPEPPEQTAPLPPLPQRVRKTNEPRPPASARGQVQPEPPQQTAPLPPLPQRVRKTNEPGPPASATGQVQPESAGSPGLASGATTEPIPLISAPAEGAVRPSSRDATSADQVRPASTARPKEARVRVLATVAPPSRPPAPPGSVPARVPDGANGLQDPAQDARTTRPAGSSLSPEADADDITEPIPVVSEVAERSAEKPAFDEPATRPARPTRPAQPAPPGRPPAQADPPARADPAAQKGARRWRLSAQPVHAEVPQPRPTESELTPMPAAAEPEQTLLRPLFVEGDPVEEVVATVRAQAADRASNNARRLWNRIRDNL